MMAETREGHETFQSLLLNLYGQVASDDPLHKLRTKAWEHFLSLGLPNRKTETFRYLRMRAFFAGDYEAAAPSDLSIDDVDKHTLPECRRSRIVFVNGSFVPEFSCFDALEKGSVTALSKAVRTYGAFLNNQWTRTLKDEADPFAALNAALHPEGAFVYLPPKTVLKAPLQILNLIDPAGRPLYLLPRLHLFAGTQSEATLVSTQAVLSEGSYAFNMASDFAVEEEAHVQYVQPAMGLPASTWHFDALRATLKRNATLKTVSVTDGAAAVRNDYRVALLGENAEAFLNGVWMLSGKNEAHTHVVVDHQAPYCRSMQLYKGAVGDTAHSSFEGKILVRQEAQKTEAFQLNNNLLLSDRAMADSKPNLEIFADDVKASHGSTVGQLDEEQIFYMKTRGFSAEEAKSLLVYGFCQEVIDKIGVASLHDSLKTAAQQYLVAGERL